MRLNRSIGFLFALCAASVVYAISFPAPNGFVNDYVGILEKSQKDLLEAELKAFAQKGGPEIAVAVVASLEGLVVEDYSIQLFKSWRVGKARKNNGVLLLFAPNEKKVRIETGYGAEGLIPDIEAKRIITDTITPLYRQGDKGGAVIAGVDRIRGYLAQEKEPIAPTIEEQKGNLGGVFVLLILVLVVGTCIVVAFFVTRRRSKEIDTFSARKRRYRDDSFSTPTTSSSSSRRYRDDSDDGFTAGAIAGSIFSNNDGGSSGSSSSGDSGGSDFGGFGGGDAGGGGASGDL